MAASLSTRKDGAIAIVEVHGNITLGPILHALQSTAKRLLNEPGCAGLVLNLAEVGTVDSAGIGGLVAVYTSAAEHKLAVALVRASPQIRRMLGITRVDEMFEFADDEQSAARQLR